MQFAKKCGLFAYGSCSHSSEVIAKMHNFDRGTRAHRAVTRCASNAEIAQVANAPERR